VGKTGVGSTCLVVEKEKEERSRPIKEKRYAAVFAI